MIALHTYSLNTFPLCFQTFFFCQKRNIQQRIRFLKKNKEEKKFVKLQNFRPLIPSWHQTFPINFLCHDLGIRKPIARAFFLLLLYIHSIHTSQKKLLWHAMRFQHRKTEREKERDNDLCVHTRVLAFPLPYLFSYQPAWCILYASTVIVVITIFTIELQWFMLCITATHIFCCVFVCACTAGFQILFYFIYLLSFWRIYQIFCITNWSLLFQTNKFHFFFVIQIKKKPKLSEQNYKNSNFHIISFLYFIIIPTCVCSLLCHINLTFFHPNFCVVKKRSKIF